jgi:hypothetical protein
MLPASDRRQPNRARGRRVACRVAAAIFAVAALLALAGPAGVRQSTVPSLIGASAQVGTHLTAVGGDAVVALTSANATVAPSGQRATPGALPALLPLALLVALLLAHPVAGHSTLGLAAQRLPSRRAPPRDAFTR